MKIAVFSLRGAASFKNQANLIRKAAVKMGFECEDRDLSQKANFPRERWDRLIVLAPLWPRYVFDAVRLCSPWLARSSCLYGPVDGPYTLNIQLFQVLENLHLVVPSRFCYDMLQRSDVKVEGVVYHGIDHEDFNFDDIPKYDRFKKLREKYPGRTIFFSNINPLHRKGLPQLVQALKILNDKRPGKWIFILHTGLEKAKNLVSDIGSIPNLVLEDAYNTMPFRQVALKTQSCDVFVWPSLLEGFGLPVLEAAAAKRPVVALDVEPMNEIVGPEEAWFFPSDGLKEEKWDGPGCVAQLHTYDPSDLAEAMMLAMDHPEESREKGEKAYKRSLDFDYVKVYEPLIKGQI